MKAFEIAAVVIAAGVLGACETGSNSPKFNFESHGLVRDSNPNPAAKWQLNSGDFDKHGYENDSEPFPADKWRLKRSYFDSYGYVSDSNPNPAAERQLNSGFFDKPDYEKDSEPFSAAESRLKRGYIHSHGYTIDSDKWRLIGLYDKKYEHRYNRSFPDGGWITGRGRGYMTFKEYHSSKMSLPRKIRDMSRRRDR